MEGDDKKTFLFAVAQSLFVFVLLLILLFIVFFLYDFSETDLGALSFLLAVTCIVLISRNVYDLARDDSKQKEEIQSELVKHAEESSTKRLFDEVYKNSPVAYLILDENSLITSVNLAGVRLLGLPLSRLIGREFFACLSTDERDKIILLREKFRNGVIIAEEEISLQVSQNQVWAVLSIFQFKDMLGKKVSLVTLLDITKQKEVDIAKSEFVSLASHQLRTPIAGMRWSAELLLLDDSEPLSVQQKKYTTRLLSNIQRMGNLVDDFLQVSRFDLGTKVAQPEAVNIKDLLEDIMSEQTVLADSKKLTIIKNYDKELTELQTDPSLMRMILTNLYNNAVKYSRDEGEVEVTFRKERNEVVFEIRDTGIGIPVSEQPRIFSKVFRASNASRDVPDGTGLGLYIAKKAVQVLRGRIDFSSTEYVGTTFSVVVPLN